MDRPEPFDALAGDLPAVPELGPVPLPNPFETRYEIRIQAAIRRITRGVDTYSRRLAQEHGVTVPQLSCLLKLDEFGPLTVKDLAAAVYLNPSTVVGIVDRLERTHLVCRERSVKDRRKVRITLTESGKELLARSPSALHDTLAAAIANLSELERATIALSLEKVSSLMERHELASAPDEPKAEFEAPDSLHNEPSTPEPQAG